MVEWGLTYKEFPFKSQPSLNQIKNNKLSLAQASSSNQQAQVLAHITNSSATANPPLANSSHSGARVPMLPTQTQLNQNKQFNTNQNKQFNTNQDKQFNTNQANHQVTQNSTKTQIQFTPPPPRTYNEISENDPQYNKKMQETCHILKENILQDFKQAFWDTLQDLVHQNTPAKEPMRL